jgi:hypothetical protein
MKTQIRITAVSLNKIDVTCSEDLPNRKFIYNPKDVTAHIVFPDEAFYMNITFPMENEIKINKQSVLAVLGRKIPSLWEHYDDIIFNGI